MSLQARLHDELVTPRQAIRRFGLRLAVLVLLALAAWLPSYVRRGGEEEVAVLIDVSNSVALEAIGTALSTLEGAAVDHLVPFADHALRVRDVEALRQIELLDQQAGGARLEAASDRAIHRDQTELARAVRSGLDLLPGGGSGRLLLSSDGNSDDQADLERALELAQRRGVRIDTIPLAANPQPPRIDRADIPSQLPLGLTGLGSVSIEAATPVTLSLEVRIDDQDPFQIEVDHPGGRWLVPLPMSFRQKGDRPVALRLLTGAATEDASATALPKSAPSRWRATVRVVDKPRVLLIENDPRTPLMSGLSERGLDLVRRGPRSLPTRAATFAQYSSVVLHDVDANDLGPESMAALADWVRLGGSLFFASGESSYGQGGYDKTPIAMVLPVTFEVKEEKAEVALMIALDKSYSMKGDKMDLAKEAAKAALGELEDEHLFGLVAFDWNTFDIVPLQQASRRDAIREQISRIEASAQTNFYPALESCLKQLSAIEDPSGKIVKHVILVSDGKTYPDDYEGLVRRMYEADITVSTVAVGLESDVELLQQIAQWGHGRSYFVQDAARVQKILLDEARSKLEDTLVEESTAVVVRSSHPVLYGIDMNSAPALLGYVSYRAKPGAEVILETEDERPILARQRVGLGETWVFAADLADRWSAPWLEWSGFTPLISQVLHRTVSGPFAPPDRFAVERHGDRFLLSAELRYDQDHPRAGEPHDGARAVAMIGGAAPAQTIGLDQVSPGRYLSEVRLPPDPSGDIRFELIVDGKPSGLRSLYYPGTDELTPLPMNIERLTRVAEQTGGTAWEPGQFAEALEPRPRDVVRAVSLWRWFLGAALLLYLLDLLLHRKGRLDAPFES